MSDSEGTAISSELDEIKAMLRGITRKPGEVTKVCATTTSRVDHQESRLSIGEAELLSELEEAHRDVDGSEEGKDSRQERRSLVFIREAQVSVRKQVVINVEPPTHKHIYLDFTKFIIRWFEYEQINGIKLEPAQVISRRVRNHLMFNNSMTDSMFAKLRAQKFCEMMAKETKVLSTVEFVDTLKHALRFLKPLDWKSVCPNTHEILFQDILKRKSIFMRTVGIMMEANSRLCPPVGSREYGSAQVFLDLVDEGYNKRILAEIPRVTDTNYTNVEEFLNQYVFKVSEHYEASKNIRLCLMRARTLAGSRFRDVLISEARRLFPKTIRVL